MLASFDVIREEVISTEKMPPFCMLLELRAQFIVDGVLSEHMPWII